MNGLLPLLVALLVGVAVHRLLALFSYRGAQVAASLERAGRYGGFGLKETEVSVGVGERLVGPSTRHLARVALRLTPKSSIPALRDRLRAAGLGQVTPTSFLAAKGALAGVAFLLGLLMLVAGSLPPLMGVAIALGGGWTALLLPDYWLTLRFRARKEEMLVQMPDVLDLMTVSVEAGLGFDAALLRISERMQGPLVEEFQVVMHEMRIGETRAKALRSFAERIDEPETTTLARAITQADQLGIPLGRILRVQAKEIRQRRETAAEEKAMKAPIKMLFPTVLFIFPAMFVVLLGPAIIQISRVLGNDP